MLLLPALRYALCTDATVDVRLGDGTSVNANEFKWCGCGGSGPCWSCGVLADVCNRR